MQNLGGPFGAVGVRIFICVLSYSFGVHAAHLESEIKLLKITFQSSVELLLENIRLLTKMTTLPCIYPV